MIPLRDVIPTRTFPVVTIALIALNTAVFVLQQSLAAEDSMAVARRYGVIPASFEWWTAVTASFVHPGWVGFATNMLMLWLFGGTLEDRTGRGRYLAFYLTCAAVATAAQAWSQPATARPTLGASGALAGILGAYFLMYPRSRVLALVPVPVVWPMIELPAVALLGFWLFVQLVSGMPRMPAAEAATVDSFSFAACSAAFLGGALLIPLFRRAERVRVEWWHDRPRDVGH